jgi:hypothetical protein
MIFPADLKQKGALRRARKDSHLPDEAAARAPYNGPEGASEHLLCVRQDKFIAMV